MRNEGQKKRHYNSISLYARLLLAENGIQAWLDFAETIKPLMDAELRDFDEYLEEQITKNEKDREEIEDFYYDTTIISS
jgi:hypothetical protein